MLLRGQRTEGTMNEQKILYVVIAAVGTGLSNNLLEKIRMAEDPSGKREFRIAVLTEDQWILHRSLLGENHRILFIGPLQQAEELFRAEDVKFDRHGIRYGEREGMAFLRVEKSLFESKAEIELFEKEWRKECGFAAGPTEKKPGSGLSVLSMLAIALFVPLGYILVGGRLVKDHLNAAENLRRKKYMYGFTVFMKYYVQDFMKNAGTGPRAELTCGASDGRAHRPASAAGAFGTSMTPEQRRALAAAFTREMEKLYRQKDSGGLSDSSGRKMDLTAHRSSS